MKKIAGSVSIVIALTITIMLSFCMILIESARENTMLLKADIVFDAGIQSVLAEYHKILWEEYDLLYIDCSYGQAIPSYTNTLNHLEQYINQNLKYDKDSWLQLNYEKGTFGEVQLSTDGSGADFYSQAIFSVKEATGLTYVNKILDWLTYAKDIELMQEDMDNNKNHIHKEIEEANELEVKVKEAVWGIDIEGNQVLLEEAEYEKVDIDNPLEEILDINILLKQVITDFSKISSKKVDTNTLASGRQLAFGDGYDDTKINGLLNKVLFCNYLFKHFGSYVDELNKDSDSMFCEIEYLLGGKNDDYKNLELVAAEILALREVDNYLNLLQNSEKTIEAHTIAAAASTLIPWLEPVVYQAMMIYWAYQESIQDLQILFRGEKVPLIKAMTKEWKQELWLGYEEYLMLLLMMYGQDVLTMRAIDLIELRLREVQKDFRMDACISSAKVVGEFSDSNKKKYIISQELIYK